MKKRHVGLLGVQTTGASFTIRNRFYRIVWGIGWFVLARWTPPPLHSWRRVVLRIFGAQIERNVRIYGSARIWYPPNLRVGENTIIGPGVILYNQGEIDIGSDVVVSQRAHLCASSHDISDPLFTLILRPIYIEKNVWVAAEAFIGPGVRVGAGAVVAARAALFKDAEPWTVSSGNPAKFLKIRHVIPMQKIGASD